MGLRCHFIQIDDEIAERLVSGERPRCATGASLDIDKAWGGIHYLLSGSVDSGTEPERLIMSGFLIPDVSEHVAVHRASAVADFGALLDRTSDDQLLERMDVTEMNRLDVYPGDWSGDERAYLTEYLVALRQFISDTVSKEKALTVSIL